MLASAQMRGMRSGPVCGGIFASPSGLDADCGRRPKEEALGGGPASAASLAACCSAARPSHALRCISNFDCVRRSDSSRARARAKSAVFSAVTRWFSAVRRELASRNLVICRVRSRCGNWTATSSSGGRGFRLRLRPTVSNRWLRPFPSFDEQARTSYAECQKGLHYGKGRGGRPSWPAENFRCSTFGRTADAGGSGGIYVLPVGQPTPTDTVGE
jgi:hypothetical protein